LGNARLSVVQDLGRHSIGEDSAFDKLRKKGGTRFLFLGVSPSKCMTYTHYVEERLGVPYRYNRDFTGTITDDQGTARETYSLFVRYRGVIPSGNNVLEQELIGRGLMAQVPCGDSQVTAVDEPFVYDTL
jgi:aminoglycoside 3-N-acetyltransferase